MPVRCTNRTQCNFVKLRETAKSSSWMQIRVRGSHSPTLRSTFWSWNLYKQLRHRAYKLRKWILTRRAHNSFLIRIWRIARLHLNTTSLWSKTSTIKIAINQSRKPRLKLNSESRVHLMIMSVSKACQQSITRARSWSRSMLTFISREIAWVWMKGKSQQRWKNKTSSLEWLRIRRILTTRLLSPNQHPSKQHKTAQRHQGRNLRGCKHLGTWRLKLMRKLNSLSSKPICLYQLVIWLKLKTLILLRSWIFKIWWEIGSRFRNSSLRSLVMKFLAFGREKQVFNRYQLTKRSHQSARTLSISTRGSKTDLPDNRRKRWKCKDKAHCQRRKEPKATSTKYRDS